jgi:hypothetical protein
MQRAEKHTIAGKNIDNKKVVWQESRSRGALGFYLYSLASLAITITYVNVNIMNSIAEQQQAQLNFLLLCCRETWERWMFNRRKTIFTLQCLSGWLKERDERGWALVFLTCRQKLFQFHIATMTTVDDKDKVNI